MAEGNPLDQNFRRAKDLGLLSLVAFIWGVAVLYGNLPKDVQAQETRISAVEKNQSDIKVQFIEYKSDVKALIQRVDEMREDVRETKRILMERERGKNER